MTAFTVTCQNSIFKGHREGEDPLGADPPVRRRTGLLCRYRLCFDHHALVVAMGLRESGIVVAGTGGQPARVEPNR